MFCVYVCPEYPSLVKLKTDLLDKNKMDDVKYNLLTQPWHYRGMLQLKERKKTFILITLLSRFSLPPWKEGKMYKPIKLKGRWMEVLREDSPLHFPIVRSMTFTFTVLYVSYKLRALFELQPLVERYSFSLNWTHVPVRFMFDTWTGESKLVY